MLEDTANCSYITMENIKGASKYQCFRRQLKLTVEMLIGSFHVSFLSIITLEENDVKT